MKLGRWVSGVVVVGTGVFYAWLAYPHNAFPSNARFHWVDYLTYDSDNFFYAAGRLPHMLFYEAPHMWQGITAALVSGLLLLIARQLGLSIWIAAAVALIPAVAGNFLLFASTAEDVMLNFVLLLMVLSASLSRRPVLVGLSLGAAVLGRPSFLVFTGCLVGAELVRATLGKNLRAFDWRYVGGAGGVAVGFTVVAQALFTVLGQRYFLVDGRILDTRAWDSVLALEVDNFTIYPFSGTYFLHALWVIPAVVLVLAVLGVFTAKGQHGSLESTIYLAALASLTHLLIHEGRPTQYYNIRYLSYILPFVFFVAIAATAHPRFPRDAGVRWSVMLLLVLSTTAFPSGAVALKEHIEAQTDHELLAVKEDLREIVQDRRVILTYGNRGSRNYLAYVLKGNINAIRLIEDTDVRPEDIIISTAEEPWGSDPVLRTASYLVFDPSRSNLLGQDYVHHPLSAERHPGIRDRILQ